MVRLRRVENNAQVSRTLRAFFHQLVGLKNLDQGGSSPVGVVHAARTYSLISPPRISFRSIRVSIGVAVRSVEEVGALGGRWSRERCGRWPL